MKGQIRMNVKLREAALELVNRAGAAGHKGKTANKRQIAALVKDAKGQIPAWFVELLTTIPLCGLELGWQASNPKADYDGVAWMTWSDAANIRSESLEYYPGLAILEHGYVNVASDPEGSGDPYFIHAGKSDDPPLYQVFHDVSDEASEILAEGRTLVAKSLSAFFRKAILPER